MAQWRSWRIASSSDAPPDLDGRDELLDATPGPLSHRAITDMVQSAQKAFNRALARSA